MTSEYALVDLLDLAMRCHQKGMVDDLRATIATLAERHGLGLIITQGDTTMACGPRAEACLKFIMEEGEIRGLKYSGPATRPKDFMSPSSLKYVQDVELDLVYDMDPEGQGQGAELFKSSLCDEYFGAGVTDAVVREAKGQRAKRGGFSQTGECFGTLLWQHYCQKCQGVERGPSPARCLA